MAEPENGQVPKRTAETDEIISAVNRAFRQAVIEHALLGHSVPYSVNGKVVWVPPAEILASITKPNEKLP
jgi:hypothetical protein